MKKIIYDNEFVTIHTEKEKSLISITYKHGVDYLDLTPEIYKEIMITFGKEVQAEQLTKNLINGREAELILTPDIQKWVAREISPMVKSLEKIAFITSNDIFTHISNGQMMKEKGIRGQYETAYFDSLEKANQWLDII